MSKVQKNLSALGGKAPQTMALPQTPVIGPRSELAMDVHPTFLYLVTPRIHFFSGRLKSIIHNT